MAVAHSPGAFFYGSLMEPLVLYRICYGSATPESWQKDLLTFRPAILRHHQRHCIKGADYPALLPTSQSANSLVKGIFVTGLTGEDLWRLDIFEGKEYERKRVKIQILVRGNEAMPEVDADTYIWVAEEKLLEKYEWNFEAFVNEKLMLHWVDVELGTAIRPSYREVDEAVEARRQLGHGVCSEGDAGLH